MEDPLKKFADWLAEARATPVIAEPTAMTLATASADGTPSARIVLLKEFGPKGFVFYTNLQSRKGRELSTNPRAALCFYWMPLDRQIRIEGTTARVSDAEADAYFATRERGKQIGAWASHQSEALRDRQELEERVVALTKKYEGLDIPRPPHWSGTRLMPHSIEFWHQGLSRLHERERYDLVNAAWQHRLLNP